MKLDLVARATRRPAVKALGLAVCGWPIIVLIQQSAVLLLGWLVSVTIGSGTVPNPGLMDEVYWRLAMSMLGSAKPTGIAFGLPFGAAFSAGASIVGVQLLELVVNAAMIAAGSGVLVVSYGRPRRRRARRLLCSLEARVAAVVAICLGLASELQLPWTSGGGEMMLSMVATKLGGLSSDTYDQAVGLEPGLSAGINLAIAGGVALAAAALALGFVRLSRGQAGLQRISSAAKSQPTWRHALTVGAFVALLAPIQGRAVLQEDRSPALQAAAAAEQDAALATSENNDDASPSLLQGLQDGTAPFAPTAATVVTITSDGNKFGYKVNGRPEFIRGVGYNPITRGQSTEQRRAHYERDFRTMAGLGMNTAVGWDENEFDDVLMDRATAHGVGIILPFDLHTNWNYEDPDVRARLREAIALRVLHFKDSPALRMWGLGNEVLHDMTKNRAKPSNLTAFAEFEVAAADMIHNLDPNHPVVYRDAEDVYMRPIAAALRESDAARPWFVYGMNFFTSRLDDVLSKGAIKGLHQPLLVSEFGPLGLRPSDRPSGYVRLWNIIRSHSNDILGGCAYVWAANGPEPLDRNFGLTNDAGVPVDGTAQALANLFKSDQAREELLASGQSSS